MRGRRQGLREGPLFIAQRSGHVAVCDEDDFTFKCGGVEGGEEDQGYEFHAGMVAYDYGLCMLFLLLRYCPI